MKRTLLIIFAILICTSFVSCKEEKEKKVTIESEIINEGGYEFELKETVIIAPEGNEIAPYEPITKDAVAKTIDEITGLNDIIAIFESCYNGAYTVEYDENSPLASDEEFFLVTNYASESEVRSALLKTFQNESLIDIIREDVTLKEENGKLYYRPASNDNITFKAAESTINYSNSESCELSVPMYSKNGDKIGVYNIEFTKTEEGFIISYLTTD